jgi:hypothetical protein
VKLSDIYEDCDKRVIAQLKLSSLFLFHEMRFTLLASKVAGFNCVQKMIM